MLRENYNNDGIVKEYKNGNLTIRYYEDGKKSSDEVLTISELLWSIDCYFIGETYCLNNWETGNTIYNCYSDKVYIFPWAALAELQAGKTIRLYARQPDETDREIISQEWE